ncbi:oligosaccharide flippase family protein [Apilactobacillus timberlakei]|uniref:oligosaccharide flippase family protein n=1 Tax=Apilactobacillus timberlakei TaxID=2008380 RepID=UPI00112848AF|nr:lipopolysaccharide biosynthesis protein [Apilactobacillus timberlakei]TPR14810.1 lipopolysaccharide biosynthesis protein [Apilactobacillus timberlakei]
MDKIKSFIKDALKMILSNSLFLFTGILSSFIIPIILSKADYGYYKIFLLYTGYVSLFHFGFVDGILLKLSGKNYNELDTRKIRSYSNFFIAFEFFISLILNLSIPFFSIDYTDKIIFLLICISIFLTNVQTYYQFIARSLLRFSQISFMSFLQAILNVIMVLGSLLIYKLFNVSSLYYYLICVVSSNFIITSIYIYKYRELTFGIHDRVNSHLKDIVQLFKNGIFLTVSYQSANIFTNLDNQIISMLFKSSLYAEYAFTYSIVSVISTVLNSMSSMVFPYMSNYKKETVIKNHSNIVKYISILSMLMISLYYPFEFIVNNFLSKYNSSLTFLKPIIPLICINSIVDIVIFNFFIYLKKNRSYLLINLFNILISVSMSWGVYFIFGTPLALAYVSLISALIWIFSLELYLHINYQVDFVKNYLYIVCVITLFLIIASMFNGLFLLLIYIATYIIVTFLFYKSDVIIILHYLMSIFGSKNEN